MKIILYPFRVMALFFLLCSDTNSYPQPLSIKNSPTSEVADLVEKLVMADSKQSTEILTKINTIRNKHPENTDILLMYAHSLIGEKRYREGIDTLKILYEKKTMRTYLLTQCLLKERLGGKERSCYDDIVQLSEKKNLIDSDYITALFFTDMENFKTVKQQLIKEHRFKESDFFVFTLGKEKMLHEFFP